MLDSAFFDPQSAGFAEDPYAVYDTMRGGGPFYYADVETWMLSRAADIEQVARDPAMVRTRDHLIGEEERRAEQRKIGWHDMPYHERFVQTNLLESEGETHKRLRKLVMRDFSAGMVARQRDTIQAYVDRLLGDLDGREVFDFIEDFAAHVPGHIIGRVIGVPDEDCPQLRVWSEEVVRFFDVGRGPDDKRRAEAATKEFYEYLVWLIGERRKASADDLLTRMIGHVDAHKMSEDELIATAMLILMAGHGSTIDVLGSGMHALLRFPDQHRRLREDAGLMPHAVQEMFRFEPPLPYFHRFSTEDAVIGGQAFPAGTRFGLLYAAGNRDPEAFERPNEFLVDRQTNTHLSFGRGAHFCLGNHLARLDMDVIFSTCHRLFAEIELAEEPVYKRGLSVRGPKALMIRVTRP
ncbi:MAG: cytochrome P450 [Pseudomonadota bacterium]